MTKPLFIAEVSSNHNQELSRCFEFIDAAAAMGCGAVKFQLFRISELFAPEVLAVKPDLCTREAWELPEEYIPGIAAHCRKRNILFYCTPFYLDAVDALDPHVDGFKIASYELLWTDLLVKVARTGKPIILSTGMADSDEVARAVATLREAGCKALTLLHCVSGYPIPPDQANLLTMDRLREQFRCPVGWSDHSRIPGVVLNAVFGHAASVVEFHLDLEGAGAEFQTGHCWLPDEMEPVIRTVNDGLAATGDGSDALADCEADDRQWRADPVDGLRPLREIRSDVAKGRG